mmetsp:Transcript_23065/g.62880  ORF Transcript_23065/g.62880 Transcript_23065/m.62880 type:complete len:209 (-) Transcript_23065:243-869(-)
MALMTFSRVRALPPCPLIDRIRSPTLTFSAGWRRFHLSMGPPKAIASTCRISSPSDPFHSFVVMPRLPKESAFTVTVDRSLLAAVIAFVFLASASFSARFLTPPLLAFLSATTSFAFRLWLAFASWGSKTGASVSSMTCPLGILSGSFPTKTAALPTAPLCATLPCLYHHFSRMMSLSGTLGTKPTPGMYTFQVWGVWPLFTIQGLDL